jgi:hypothetical protein
MGNVWKSGVPDLKDLGRYVIGELHVLRLRFVVGLLTHEKKKVPEKDETRRTTFDARE